MSVEDTKFKSIASGVALNLTIKKAIELRKSEKYDESRALLLPLLSEEKNKAKACLHIAWSYDKQGNEQAAVDYYKSALAGTLSSEEHFEAVFGLACTLRSLGQYKDALPYFEQTLSEYPDSIEAQPFYAMCLYNVGRNKEAVSLLLSLLVSTTDNKAINNYQTAISLYAEDLDKKW